MIAKRIPGNKPFDLEHAPERLWIYTDVYGVLRAAVYGPHKTRPSVQYVRADIAHASPPPP